VKIFIPKINNIVSIRREYIDCHVKETENLSLNAKQLFKEIELAKKEGIIKSTEIIKNAINESQISVDASVSLLREKNETLANSVQGEIRRELENLENTAKAEIGIVVNAAFLKLLNCTEII
jgi:F0F1-type ATP synthase membrane subunit b/b'